MHPKIMKRVDEFRWKMKKVEKSEPQFVFVEKLLKQYKEFEGTIRCDWYGDTVIDINFSKRSDLDLFLIALADYLKIKEIELQYSDGCLDAWADRIKINCFPKEGSDCELVQVDEEFVPGHTRPIYKMKCEHEHEEAEKAASK